MRRMSRARLWAPRISIQGPRRVSPIPPSTVAVLARSSQVLKRGYAALAERHDVVCRNSEPFAPAAPDLTGVTITQEDERAQPLVLRVAVRRLLGAKASLAARTPEDEAAAAEAATLHSSSLVPTAMSRVPLRVKRFSGSVHRRVKEYRQWNAPCQLWNVPPKRNGA